MRYLIRFSYDGTKFHGFQRQKIHKNVQGTLENILSNYFGEDIIIKGSGRTDAGVHAINQCAHFDISKKVTNKDIRKINELLNNEIVINKCKLVSSDFHARFNVKNKTYIYKINVDNFKEEMIGYYYQSKVDYDIKLMKEASILLVGTHDFHNFVSGVRDDYVSTIFKIKIKKSKNIITFTFKGIGFYRYMVRHIVGALLSVGKHKSNIKDIKNMLENPNIKQELPVVPADGLYLVQVKY